MGHVVWPRLQASCVCVCACVCVYYVCSTPHCITRRHDDVIRGERQLECLPSVGVGVVASRDLLRQSDIIKQRWI